MKFFFISVSICFSFCIFLLVGFIQEFNEELPEKAKLINALTENISNVLDKEYNLNLVAVGRSGDESGLKKLILEFFLNRLVTKNEGRTLIVKCNEIILNEINSFEKLKPFLSEFPFTLKNIEIVVFFYSNSKHHEVVEPDICCISLNEGILRYEMQDAIEPHHFKLGEQETFEEALKITGTNN